MRRETARRAPLMISLLALVVAVGTGTAAASFLITSSKQIKPGAIKGSNIAKGTIKPANLAAGAAGALTVRKVNQHLDGTNDATVTAKCKTGERATGGGYGNNAGGLVLASQPAVTGGKPTGWSVTIGATLPPTATDQEVDVVCLK